MVRRPHLPHIPLVDRLRGRMIPEQPYDPATYWEGRAADYIEGCDHPELYAQRGWMHRGRELEEEVVPKILERAEAKTVLVPGAGSGAQYAYLLEHGFEPRGFDISPTLVATCRKRFPTVCTTVGSVVGAEQREEPADAIVVSSVLQHIQPHEIAAAVESLKALARTTIVIRESIRLDRRSSYQFVHDYRSLFADWHETHRELADEAAHFRTELVAWRRL